MPGVLGVGGVRDSAECATAGDLGLYERPQLLLLLLPPNMSEKCCTTIASVR